MGKTSLLPMEFFTVLMLSVAVFLSHGDKNAESSFGSIATGSAKDRNERVIDYEYGANAASFDSDDHNADSTIEYFPNGKDNSQNALVSSSNEEVLKSNSGNILELEKRRNDKKYYNRKFKYDPALALMGLGKRISQYDPALKYMGLGKRYSQYDPALQYMGLGKRKSQYDPALQYMGLGKRKSQYDPALQYMGLGKRKSQYDPALQYMGLGKRKSQYDPALQYMGLGKRKSQYDPALQYMGLGKRKSQYDPALQYMGLGKRKSQFDPALQYMGLGKRSSSYDPGIKYMGLGKRISQYDPALQYMGLGKRKSQYDPALQYMGLGKRKSQYDPALNYMGLGKRSSSYDPGMRYMGLGKRSSTYDPALKYMGLGKRSSTYDPALKYMGLGKREKIYDSTVVNNSGSSTIDDVNPTMKISNSNSLFLNDNNPSYNELQKRMDKFDPALLYMGLGKRKFIYDPAVKYMGLGKRAFENDSTMPFFDSSDLTEEEELSIDTDSPEYRSEKNSNTNKRGFKSSNNYRTISNDGFSKIPGLGKRPYKYDPALRFMGLGKRSVSESYHPTLEKREYKANSDFKPMKLEKQENSNFGNLRFDKRRNKFDPALNYMGLGKREELELQNGIPQYENLISGTFREKNKNDDSAYDLSKEQQENNSIYPESKEKLNKIPNNIDKFQSLNIPSVDNAEIHTVPVTSKLIIHAADSYTAEDKRTSRYDPALLYMGLGKRANVYDSGIYYKTMNKGNEIDSTYKHSKPRIAQEDDSKIDVGVVELTKPNRTNDCGSKCLIRKKRRIQFKNELNPLDFEDEQGLTELIPARKRERDNRPRYNPGWIFIGLGKRDNGESRMKKAIHDEEVENLENKLKYNAFLGDYYELLNRIKDKIQKIKFMFSDDDTVGFLEEPTKIQDEMIPTTLLKDDYLWPTTTGLVISGGIPPNTWLDFIPTLEKNSK